MKTNSLLLTQFPQIAAVYYGLLQSGYDYYSIERGPEHIASLHDYMGERCSPSFFSEARQDTCDVYPYWPRAFILEAATFYIDDGNTSYYDFRAFQNRIMSSKAIEEKERDNSLWKWLSGFPKALAEVLSNKTFSKYLEWEKKWIAEQSDIHQQDLESISRCLNYCTKQWQSPVQSIQIYINPIKCVYSSDYHLVGSCFIFSSGACRTDSIIHEFLHHVVHPIVEQQKEEVLRRRPTDKLLDDSYYLSGDDAGVLNGFEETVVRRLTEKVMNDEYPKDLLPFIEAVLNDLESTGRASPQCISHK